MKTLTEILFGKRTQNTQDADTTRQIVVPETTPVQETLQESTVMSEDEKLYPVIYQFTTKPAAYSSSAETQKSVLKTIIDNMDNNAASRYHLGVELGEKGTFVRGFVKLNSLAYASTLKKTIEDGYSLDGSKITPLKTEEPEIIAKLAKEKEEATAKYTKLLSEQKDTEKNLVAKGAKETESAVLVYQNLIDAISAAPKAIYQFETAPMTVEEANARVANINCILGTYTANIASKNFAAYATRKTQVQMKDLLDKKNLLVEPEQFIAGVITIDGVPYAEQVKDTIEAIIPMAKSALTYQGKKLDEKVADK